MAARSTQKKPALQGCSALMGLKDLDQPGSTLHCLHFTQFTLQISSRACINLRARVYMDLRLCGGADTAGSGPPVAPIFAAILKSSSGLLLAALPHFSALALQATHAFLSPLRSRETKFVCFQR